MLTTTRSLFFIFTALWASLLFLSDGQASPSVICLGHCDKPCNCKENYTFQCADGSCIPLTNYKNQIVDCKDGSDEAVSCCPNQFMCDRKNGIGKCLDVDKLDNGIVDCVDQTDETINNQKSCTVLEKRASKASIASQLFLYKCSVAANGSKSGKCIDIHSVLDGKEDCPMGEDEDATKFDKCALKTANCSANATCAKTLNGYPFYSCSCAAGFAGDGFQCSKA